MKTRILILAMLLALGATAQWTRLDTGLYVMEYQSPVKSEIGNSVITVLKVDPTVYRFHIFCERQHLKERSARGWCKDFDQVAAINAGMFMDNGRNCGYMVSGRFENGKESKQNCIFAYDTRDSLPVQIIDRQYQDWPDLKTRYTGMTQSIRMVDINQRNCWAEQEKKWSVSCLAMDRSGNVLMIHCRSPYTMHAFVDIMLAGPFDIYNMMYLEGGPVAQMYINTGETELARVGSYESGYYQTDENDVFWTLPNVIAISKY